MYERFNNSFQNVTPNANTNINPYSDQYFGRYDKVPYAQGMNSYMPQPMPGGMTEDSLYPLESSMSTPYLNNPAQNISYKDGGEVKAKKVAKNNPYPQLAELIRQQGKGEDSILAHINPVEAMILKNIGGSGTINSKTGLPQFGFLKNPFKILKNAVGGVGGSILGNMIAPGFGGIIGGALGQGAQNKMRGKGFLPGALKGAIIGGSIPSVSSLAGSGLNAMGANNVGASLSNYGTQNAILPSLGFGNAESTGASVNSMNQLDDRSIERLMRDKLAREVSIEELPFKERLLAKGSDFLTDPKNLLSVGAATAAFMGRPKEETPERRADKEKRYQRAMRLSPDELAAQERDFIALEQSNRRVQKNRFLPEDRIPVTTRYSKVNTPEEYRRRGRWIEYYDNPDFQGEPINMKKGGSVLPQMIMARVEEYPDYGLIEGFGGGQDDDTMAELPENSYIIDATTVSNIGDGNSMAGAKKLDAFISNGEYYVSPDKVAKLGNGSHKVGTSILNKMIKGVQKHKTGKVGIPPKAKSLTSYIMR